MFFNNKENQEINDFIDDIGGSDHIDYNLIIVSEGITFRRSYSYLLFSNFIFFLLTSFWTGFWYFLIINTIMWFLFFNYEIDAIHGQGDDQASIDRWKMEKETYLKKIKQQKSGEKIKLENTEEAEDIPEDIDIELIQFYEEYGLLSEKTTTFLNYMDNLRNYDIFYHFFLIKSKINFIDLELDEIIKDIIWNKEEINLEKLTIIEKNHIKNYKFKENILYDKEDVYILYNIYLDILNYLNRNNNIKYEAIKSKNLSWISYNKMINFCYKEIIEVYYRKKKKKK